MEFLINKQLFINRKNDIIDSVVDVEGKNDTDENSSKENDKTSEIIECIKPNETCVHEIDPENVDIQVVSSSVDAGNGENGTNSDNANTGDGNTDAGSLLTTSIPVLIFSLLLAFIKFF